MTISTINNVIEWDENTPTLLQSKLHPGDILFYYSNRSNNITEALDRISIIGGQQIEKLQNPFLQSETENLQNCIHVAIYVGRGKFAEATFGLPEDEDVRIGNFNEKCQIMLEGSERSIKVSRLKNADLAFEMANIAIQLAEDKSNKLKGHHKTRNAYSLALAASAIFKKYYSEESKTVMDRRSLNQAIEIATLQDPKKNDLNEKKLFFCSQFFIECLQRAEISLNKDLMNAVKKKLKQHNLNKDTINRSEFKNNRLNAINEIFAENSNSFQSLKFQLNPDSMTPAKARYFVLNSTNFFYNVLEIRAKP